MVNFKKGNTFLKYTKTSFLILSSFGFGLKTTLIWLTFINSSLLKVVVISRKENFQQVFGIKEQGFAFYFPF